MPPMLGARQSRWSSLALTIYDDALAIHSLRRLSGRYFGAAINVRRSNDNATRDIGFLSDGSLDTASLLSFTGANNGYVPLWYDQSRSAKHLLQTTASSQPQIVASGSVLSQSGKPTLTFNGVQGFQRDHGVTYAVPNTMFAMARNTNTTAFLQMILVDGLNSSNRNTIYISSNSDRYSIFRGAENATSITRNTLPYIYSVVFNISCSMYMNGSSQTSGDAGAASFQPITLGARFSMTSNWEGNISEYIFFNADKTGVRARIEANMNNFYSVF